MGENIQNSKDNDYNTFEQILEMDDDDDREFSKEIVYSFFSQAESTIEEMKQGVYELSIPHKVWSLLPNVSMCYRKARDLPKLSSLGHFLKGSSATLGLTKIKDACEAIQHLGAGMDEPAHRNITDPQESLTRIQKKLGLMETDYESAKKTLRNFYGGQPH